MTRLAISEAAEALEVSVDTIRRWEKKGLIKASRTSGGHRTFDLDEINRLMEKINGGGDLILSRCSKRRRPILPLLICSPGRGTALGLENAGFKHLAVNEFDKWPPRPCGRIAPNGTSWKEMSMIFPLVITEIKLI